MVNFTRWRLATKEAAVAVAALGEGRMVDHLTIQPNPLGPAEGEVQMHLFPRWNGHDPTSSEKAT
jgi:hypothetical protein